MSLSYREDDIANEIAALSMEANNGQASDDDMANGRLETMPKKKEKVKRLYDRLEIREKSRKTIFDKTSQENS